MIIHDCSDCDLCVNSKFIPSIPTNNGGTKIIFIFPYSTRTSAKKGIGESGRAKIIGDYIKQYAFKCYLTNLVKCICNREPNEDEISSCIKHLKKEIFIYKPKVLITIGNTVTSQFLTYKKFSKIVDTVQYVTINNEEICVYPIYHWAVPLDVNTDLNTIYKNSFTNIATIYKYLINPLYKTYVNR